MAHVALRHATRHATREQVVPMMGTPPPVSDASLPLGLLSFLRRFELDADIMAAGVAAQAGYDPQAMAGYLESQPRAGDRQIAALYSPRPAAAKRVQAIKAAVEKLPVRAYSSGSGEFDEIRSLAGSLH